MGLTNRGHELSRLDLKPVFPCYSVPATLNPRYNQQPDPDYSQEGNYIISTVASSSSLDRTSARTSSETNARIVIDFIKISPMCLEREPADLFAETFCQKEVASFNNTSGQPTNDPNSTSV